MRIRTVVTALVVVALALPFGACSGATMTSAKVGQSLTCHLLTLEAAQQAVGRADLMNGTTEDVQGCLYVSPPGVAKVSIVIAVYPNTLDEFRSGANRIAMLFAAHAGKQHYKHVSVTLIDTSVLGMTDVDGAYYMHGAKYGRDYVYMHIRGMTLRVMVIRSDSAGNKLPYSQALTLAVGDAAVQGINSLVG